jgi:DNA-binding IclR family transcriptional regulator
VRANSISTLFSHFATETGSNEAIRIVDQAYEISTGISWMPDTSPESTGEKREASERPVAAAERTLLILDAFAARQQPLSLGDLAQATGLFKSVIVRYMISFEKMSYARKLPDGRYQMGAKAVQLAAAFEKSLDERLAIENCLARLVAATGESAFFSICDNDHRLCLFGADSPKSLRVSQKIGVSVALDDTSISQVLKEFDRAPGPREGYDDGMVRCTIGVFDPLTASISAPVFGRGGRFVGALSVSGPTQRFDVRKPAHISLLAEAARGLSAELGFPA